MAAVWRDRLTEPEVLQRFAVHHQTGEANPQALLEKMHAADKFNKGFANVEFTASALVDLAFHALEPEQASNVDPMAFQADILAGLNMPDAIVMRYATPHFGHAFSGDGYLAGYYSYMWSGVLDADTFKRGSPGCARRWTSPGGITSEFPGCGPNWTSRSPDWVAR